MTSAIIKYFADDLLKKYSFFQILVILSNLSNPEDVLECYGQDILIQMLDFYTKKHSNIKDSDEVDFFNNINPKITWMLKPDMINNILLVIQQFGIKKNPISALKYFIKKLIVYTSFIDIFIILSKFDNIDKKNILREFDDVQLYTLLYFYRKNYENVGVEDFYEILKIENEDLYEQILNVFNNSDFTVKLEEEKMNKMFSELSVDGVNR